MLIPRENAELWTRVITDGKLKNIEDQNLFLFPLLTIDEETTPLSLLRQWVDALDKRNPDILKKDKELKQEAQTGIKSTTVLSEQDQRLLEVYRELRRDAADVFNKIVENKK